MVLGTNFHSYKQIRKQLPINGRSLSPLPASSPLLNKLDQMSKTGNFSGLANFSAAELETAITYFKNNQDHHPLGIAYYQLAQLKPLAQKKDLLERSLAAYEQAEITEGASSILSNNKGATLHSIYELSNIQQDQKNSKKNYRTSQKLDPRQNSAYYNEGLLNAQSDEFDDSDRNFINALQKGLPKEFKSEISKYYFQRGLQLLSECKLLEGGKLKKSLDYLLKANALSPNNKTCEKLIAINYYYLGMSLYQAGQPAAALTYLQKFQHTKYSDQEKLANCYLVIGICNFELAQYQNKTLLKTAVYNFQKAIQNGHNKKFPIYSLAVSYALLQESRLEDYYARSLAPQEKADYNEDLANRYSDQENFAQAIVRLEKARNFYKEDSPKWKILNYQIQALKKESRKEFSIKNKLKIFYK